MLWNLSNYFNIIGNTVSDEECVEFTFEGKTYEKGTCRYDYLHAKHWCATGSDTWKQWGYCQTFCPHDNGKYLIFFVSKLFYIPLSRLYSNGIYTKQGWECLLLIKSK